jgi:membrane protein implicated in regulation of membrane protease activity
MMDILSNLGNWIWPILGILLMGLETLAPGVFLLWFGIAAIIVGILLFFIALSWQGQLLTFAVLSAAMVPLWRRFGRPSTTKTDKPFLNRRSQSLVGRVLTLEKPIVDGIGTVRIDDTIWRVEGPDAPAGSRVKIEQADGARLRVVLA